MTFEPFQVALGAWQEVKGEAMSVNEALYIDMIVGTIQPDGSRRLFEVDVVALMCCYPAHRVSSCVGGVAEWP